MRHDSLEEVLGPCLQCLSKDRVVRVSTDISHNLICFFLLNALSGQKAHQFRNDQRRVRIVDLDRRVVGKVMQVAAALHALVEDQLGGIADHEILLIDAEKLSVLIAVIGIQEEGQVFLDLFFVKTDTRADQSLIDRVQVKETKASALASVTCDIDLIHGGKKLQIAALHLIVLVGALHPVGHAPLAPVVRSHVLLAVLEGLFEQTAVVGQAYAVSGKAQCRKAVDEAGCKSAKAAVSEGGLVFKFLQLRNVFPSLSQFRFHIIVDAEVDQVVGKKFTDQEFCRNIVNFLLSAVISPVPAGVLRQGQRRVVKFQNRALAKCFSSVISEF